MHYVADKCVVIARRATQAILDVRSQGAQQSKRTNLSQPVRAQGLRSHEDFSALPYLSSMVCLENKGPCTQSTPSLRAHSKLSQS